jgi:cysteinyl-tRNA synthetase
MSLKIYNTVSRTKETFKPITEGNVGMYVCGPTVYSSVHLGNCRTFISFDIIYRYLLHLGYKVRYVRNVTDAGHLEGDRDEGDDKFSKKAKLEQLEPMEIVQRYTVGFREVMRQFNNLPPSIEPTATGHISEQIEMTKTIIDKGYAYEVDGTVYFDVEKYNAEQPYGILTNRKLEDLLEGTRALGGQDEKKGRLDFALWIKAKPEHLMQWPSPWGMGFPGWHIECSAMSSKYLGKQFDIHGGGMDLAATHHTNEIAQNFACHHTTPANIWMHTNMLTVNGARMSKSAGNGFLPDELFTGNHPLLDKGFHPMVVRFFMLQTHYRSTLDFSNEALKASEIAFKRLWTSYESLQKLDEQLTATSTGEKDSYVLEQLANIDECMNDDFNTAKVLAVLFELNALINSVKDGVQQLSIISKEVLIQLKKYYTNYLEHIFGLQAADNAIGDNRLDAAMQILINLRKAAKANKDYATSDAIRNQLAVSGIMLKDEKGGEMSWE